MHNVLGRVKAFGGYVEADHVVMMSAYGMTGALGAHAPGLMFTAYVTVSSIHVTHMVRKARAKRGCPNT